MTHEPVYLIRGTDPDGPATLRYYALKNEERGGDGSVTALVLSRAREMEAWQRQDHGEASKQPLTEEDFIRKGVEQEDAAWMNPEAPQGLGEQEDAEWMKFAEKTLEATKPGVFKPPLGLYLNQVAGLLDEFNKNMEGLKQVTSVNTASTWGQKQQYLIGQLSVAIGKIVDKMPTE